MILRYMLQNGIKLMAKTIINILEIQQGLFENLTKFNTQYVNSDIKFIMF